MDGSAAYINGFLSAVATLNSGPNHGPDYQLVLLPDAPSSKEALDAFFETLKTSRSGPYPASAWQIETRAFDGLANSCISWFFGPHWATNSSSEPKQELVESFLRQLLATIGAYNTLAVMITPPIYYNCAWEDLLLEGRDGRRWLLHFGVDD